MVESEDLVREEEKYLDKWLLIEWCQDSEEKKKWNKYPLIAGKQARWWQPQKE